MPSYTICIEPKIAVPNAGNKIDEFDERMGQLGFSPMLPARTIDGVRERVLPRGVYFGSSREQIATVRDNVVAACKETHGESVIFIALTHEWDAS